MTRNKLLIGLSTVFSTILLTFYSIAYYNLSQLEKKAHDIASEMNLSINWVQKSPMMNQLIAEVSDKDTSFTIKAKPYLFSSTIKTVIDKEAQPFVNNVYFNGIGMSASFSTIESSYSTKINGISKIQLIDAKLSSVETSEFLAVNEASFQYIINEYNMPSMITSELDHLNINNLIQTDHIFYSTKSSTPSTTNILFTVKEFQTNDSQSLSQKIKEVVGYPDNLSLSDKQANQFNHLTQPDVFDQIFPLQLDMNISIDNAILQGSPEDATGTIDITTKTAFSQAIGNIDIHQSKELLKATLSSNGLVTNLDKSKAFLNLIDPENTYNHTLQKDTINITAQTDPYTFNPIHINAKQLATYEDGPQESTLSLNIDPTKKIFAKINGKFINLPSAISEEELTFSGSFSTQLPQYKSMVEEIYALSIEENSILLELFQTED